MKRYRPLFATFTLALFMGVHPSILAADKEPAAEEKKVDPQAISILNRAVDHLAGAKQFSVTAELWQDAELNEGGRAQFTKIVEAKVRRPDHALVNVKTSVPKRSFFYDGKNFTLMDQQKGFYGTTAAPATIDETIDKMENDYGVEFPISDILISRPFGNGAQDAKAGQYLGVEPVLGVNCHHVAFQNDEVEWQAWIDEGPMAVLRKAVITSKDEDGATQLTAIFSKWDFGTKLPDFVFAFDPPPGSAKIELVPVQETSAEIQPSK